MHFDIFTLFPAMFTGPLDDSIVRRARDAGIVSLALHNIRDYAEGKHAVTDDYPYGGGGGMVMKPDPIFRAVETVLDLPQRQAGGEPVDQTTPIILLTPQGRRFTQRVAWELAEQPRIALICGRYEGVDERVRRHLCTDEISVGDFVLSGGEIAAMLLVDAVTRLLPGALGQEHGADEDSHATGLLEYPHYTRPPSFRGWQIPDVLVSGHHSNVERWRRQQALLRTWQRRPDMLELAWLTGDDLKFLERLDAEPELAGRMEDGL